VNDEIRMTKSEIMTKPENRKSSGCYFVIRHLVIVSSFVIRASSFALCLSVLSFAACRRDMYDQPKAKTLSENTFFTDGASARQIPPHTVARGDMREGSAFFTGLTNGVLVTQMPMQLTPEVLSRGRHSYDIYCAVCHGRTGAGNGEIVQRGFPVPPSYHIDRLRNAPIGYFYHVITNGYGVMYSYANRIEPADRWAIAAYMRALQLSHNAKVDDVSEAERRALQNNEPLP
jgi:cytochrome c553